MNAFVRGASERGYRFFTGVPCSYLTSVMNGVLASRDVRYVAAANEGDAVAIAAGASLAGQKTVVMCQNSGLGNAVNPLTSLNDPFQIPTILIVSRRGEPGTKDEPQHRLMGAITPDLLELMGIAHRPFPLDDLQVGESLDWADRIAEQESRPVAFIVGKGLPAEVPLPAPAGRPRATATATDHRSGGAPATRVQALETIVSVLAEDVAVIATTGKTGRELFTLQDRRQHLYQVGSMGCASSIGLGVALNTTRQVVVLDGDGAALMRMGAMATVGYYAPPNLVHVVLDNGVHDSTGGQFTVSSALDFPEIAAGCGYAATYACDDRAGLSAAMRASLTSPGPHFVHIRITPGSAPTLGRPDVLPADVARRFRGFLRERSLDTSSPSVAV